MRCLEHKQHASLLEVSLHTGRTHQIRVHNQAVGHPVVGDEKYAYQQADLIAGVNRLYLHASRLVLPWQNQTLKVEAPLPESWLSWWSELN